MTIAEMHVWFRQYAQQMGMQNVRAILPEQIDLVINSSITDTVNQVITQSIGVTNDRIITDNSKIGQINALRSLYKVKIVNAALTEANVAFPQQPFIKGNESHIKRIYADITNFDTKIINNYYKVVSENSEYSVIPSTEEEFENAGINDKIISDAYRYELSYFAKADYVDKYIRYRSFTGIFDYLYLVDLSINYKKGTSVTNYFPVRLIDDAYLADTLNDFVLRPRLRTPIAVMYNNQLDLYIDILDGNNNLPQQLETNELRVSYIAKPAVVAYRSDIQGEDVDCDLPEYMHVDILKHAVDLYNTAVQGNLYSAQQQQQAQGREMSRNQVRPQAEGYQS